MKYSAFIDKSLTGEKVSLNGQCSIEQLWKVIRKEFKNKLFKTLDKVVDYLCVVLNNLDGYVVRSVTGRDWVLSMF